MTDFTKNITDITIGIRFQRSFRIKDVLGAITDSLVYDENSPLNGYFENQNQNISEMILTNTKGSYLRVNTDDIIFKHIISKDIDEEIKFLLQYLKHTKTLIKKYGITNIIRIGIIYSHKINDDQKKFIEAIKSITNNHLTSIDDFSLSFSKKLSDPNGMIKKDVYDYKNAIYLFRKVSNNELSLGLDYQKYFNPPLDECENQDFEGFLDESKQYLINTFYGNFVKKDDTK